MKNFQKFKSHQTVKGKQYAQPQLTYFGTIAQLTTTGTGVSVEGYNVVQDKCVAGTNKKYCGA